MNGLTVELWLTLMISCSLSLHPVDKQRTMLDSNTSHVKKTLHTAYCMCIYASAQLHVSAFVCLSARSNFVVLSQHTRESENVENPAEIQRVSNASNVSTSECT